MALSLTEALDNLYTTTWQNMRSTVADQIFDMTPYWFWLKDKGRLESVEGGRFLTEPLQFDKNDNVSWIGKGGTVKMNDFQFLTVAKYDWRYLVGSIVRFGIDDQQNRGKNEIINFMNAKLENTRNALASEMETRLAGSAGTVSAGTTTENSPAIDGLQFLVADDPTASSSPGGIDQSQSIYSWWRNKSTNLTGKSFATYGVPYLRTLINNCTNNLKMDQPDLLLSGQVPYEYYEDLGVDKLRLQNTKMVDMGFQNQVYKGITWIWSPSLSTRIYCLNNNYLKLKYDPMMLFEMTDWKQIPDQVNDRAAQIISAMSFTTSRRRCQGVMYNIDTA